MRAIIADQPQVNEYIIDAVSRIEGRFSPQVAPDSSGNYSNDASTTWKLTAGPGRRLLLVVDSVDVEEQEECLYDRLEVKDALPSGPVCGRKEEGYAAVSRTNVIEVSLFCYQQNSNINTNSNAFVL